MAAPGRVHRCYLGPHPGGQRHPGRGKSYTTRHLTMPTTGCYRSDGPRRHVSTRPGADMSRRTLFLPLCLFASMLLAACGSDCGSSSDVVNDTMDVDMVDMTPDVPMCGASETDCSGTCVDTQTDG